MWVKYRQLFNSLAFFLLGMIYLYFFSTTIGIIMLLPAALFLFGYFFWGPSLTAYGHALRGNFLSAAETLAVVGDVNGLSARKRAYYFLTRAMVEESQNNLTSAEDFLNKARCEAMLPDKEEAMIRLRLAKIYLLQGRDDEAATQIEKVDLAKAGRSLRSEAELLAQTVTLRSDTKGPPRRSLFDDENE